MWTDDVINVIDVEAKVIHVVLFRAKVDDEPSPYGICDGRISELRLKICDEVVCNYSRGWDIRPTCLAAEVALKTLLYKYDGRSPDTEIIYKD